MCPFFMLTSRINSARSASSTQLRERIAALLLECVGVLQQLGTLQHLGDRRGLVHSFERSQLSHVATVWCNRIQTRCAVLPCIRACIGD